MNKRVHLLFLIASIISSCESSNEASQLTSNDQNNSANQKTTRRYVKFEPTRLEGFELEGFDVDYAYKIESSIIIVAYSNGDLETSTSPSNWGDRLLLLEGDSIQFQSKPVGDPYQYEPNFFHNPNTNIVIVICQLGNEENYGGEAFIFEGGEIEFIGNIEIESPSDTPENNCLIDIIKISERENSIYFEFDSDSLVYLENTDSRIITNDNVHYIFADQKLKLIGL